MMGINKIKKALAQRVYLQYMTCYTIIIAT